MAFELTKQHVLDCDFSHWYQRPSFKRHSLKARILPLPSDFRTYLVSDGLFVPDGSGMEDVEVHDPDASDLDARWSFPELDSRIREVIEDFGGVVFPKLNWSSPLDAAWISPEQSLRCRTPADIYLLLKSSDFVAHDLDHAFDGCVDRDSGEAVHPPLELVLKKWFDMPRSNEFRCFVKGRKLIAVSSRDVNYYDFLQPPAFQEQLLSRISGFFAEIILPNFPATHCVYPSVYSTGSLADALTDVFDVYLNRSFDRVFVVDFNPWAKYTDSLLFTWDEILDMAPLTPVLRLIASEVQASQCRPRYALNRLPKDVTQLAQGQTVSEFAATWTQALADIVAEQTNTFASDVGR